MIMTKFLVQKIQVTSVRSNTCLCSILISVRNVFLVFFNNHIKTILYEWSRHN